MLAHDAYVIQGKEDPSQILQTEISNSQPSREGFSQQMILLEEHYEEIMQRYEYVKAIQAPCLRDQWRSYFERGQTPASRAEVVKELANSGDRVKSNVAEAYCQATSDRMRPARNPLSYDEWHNAFTDQEMMTAWNILLKANSIN
jgi:tRNA C32,U32 (ribose-2'-O)-methylase TrmJ